MWGSYVKTSQIAIPIGWFFLECKADLRSAIGDNKSRYIVQQDEDLRVRLIQCWAGLTPDLRRALITFLDTLDAPELICCWLRKI